MSDVTLNQNVQVSARHFCIRNVCTIMLIQVNGTAMLTDFSLNGTQSNPLTEGTWINGKNIKNKSIPLADGAEIFLENDHYFVFLYPGSKLNLINERFYVFESKELGRGTFAQGNS